MAENAVETAANSSGSALAENEKYLDSIAGKLNLLTSAFEELSQTVVDSELLKVGIDFLSNTVEGLNSFIEQIGVLPALIASISAAINISKLSKGEGFIVGVGTIKDLAAGFQLLGEKATWLQIKNTLLAGSFKLLGLAMQTIAFAAITAAISALISGISKAAHRMEEMRETALSAGDAFDDQIASIESYKKKIDALKTSLDYGNLSEEEAYKTRQELLGIQEEIIDTLGEEAGAFNILTSSIDDANMALDKYSTQKARRLLNENYDVYKEAVEKMTADSGVQSTISFNAKSSEEIGAVNDVKNLLTSIFGDKAVFSGQNGTTIVTLRVDAQEAVEGLEIFGDEVAKLEAQYAKSGLNLNDLLNVDMIGKDSLDEIVGSMTSEAQKIIDKFGENYNNFITQTVVANDEYRNLMLDMTDAQERYDEALASGDADKMQAAAAEIDAFSLGITNISDEEIREYFEDLHTKMLKESEKHVLAVRIQTALEMDENGLKTSLERYLQLFTGADGSVSGADLNQAIQTYAAKSAAAEAGGTVAPLSYVEQAASGIVALYKQWGYEAEEIADSLTELGYITKEVAENTSEIDLKPQIEALKTNSDKIATLQGLLDDIEESRGALSLDTLNAIYEAVPEAAGKILDAADAQEVLNDALDKTKGEASTAYAAMTIANQDWVDSALASGSALSETLRIYYGADAERWLDLANGKWKVDSELVKNLSGLWGKYSQLSTADIEAQLAQYRSILAEQKRSKLTGVSIFGNEVDMDQYNELKTVLELRKSIESGFEELYKNSTSKTSSSTEKYVANLDEYREALEKITQIQLNREKLQFALDNSDDLKEQISLQHQLTDSYEEEQSALHTLNNMRDAAIRANLETLASYGVISEYNADTNELWFKNIEAIQGVSAGSTEATNELIKELEDLYEATIDLNAENQESSSTWWDLEGSIKDAKDAVIELLDAIVEDASTAIDSMQGVYSTLKDAANEFAETGGYLSVDTFQSIIGLGLEYMSFLKDESGQLVINEERIRAVVAARTEELAVESALTYVEKLRIAMENNDIATLNQLLNATVAATDATWGLVYANLAMLKVNNGMTDSQYSMALDNINAMRSMADNVIANLDSSMSSATTSMSDYYEKMANGLESVLDYVMDMVEDQVERQIDALEEMKDAYSNIIELRKESIEEAKEEADRQKDLADKVAEMAKLQSRIDLLSLDDSREAQAERAALTEELKALQDEVAAEQADYALEVQQNALDDMEEAYHAEKDEEIKVLEDSISSTEKIYEKAIALIEDDWNGLYDQLLAWNYEYGSTLESELVSAWEAASRAVQQYGSYVEAVAGVDAAQSSLSSGSNTVVGTSSSYDTDSIVGEIIREMKRNADAWKSSDTETQKKLDARNLELGASLKAYGIDAYRDQNGVWYVGNEKLFDKYSQCLFHTGGIVGGGSLKANEQFAILKDDEWVLSEEMVKNLSTQIDRIRTLTKSIGNFRRIFGSSNTFDAVRTDAIGSVSNITSNQPVEIKFGDTIIHGADQSTVQQHVEVSRDMVNQIARILKLKW